jgi:hypothetical protein
MAVCQMHFVTVSHFSSQANRFAVTIYVREGLYNEVGTLQEADYVGTTGELADR